jgi:tetratricopeptide (TPR) repeat protein
VSGERLTKRHGLGLGILGFLSASVVALGAGYPKPASKSPVVFEPVPPEEALYHYLRSQWSFANFGVLGQTEQELTKAIQADPGAWYLSYQMAEYFLMVGAFSKAKQQLILLLQEHPGRIELELLQAKTHTLLTEFRDAQRMYESILGRLPEHEEAMFHLSLVYAAQQDYSNALRMLKRMERVSEQLSLVYLYQARIYLEMGDEDKAMDVLSEAIRHEVEHPEIFLLLAVLKENRGKIPESIPLYEEYSQLRPEDLDVIKKRVDLYVGQGMLEKAMPLLTELYRIEPTNFKVGLKIALIHIENNQLDLAKSVLEELAAKTQGTEVVSYYLGVVCQMKQDLLCSERAYGGITKDSPYYSESVLQRAFIFIGLKQYQRAIDVIRKSKQEGLYTDNHVLVLSAAYELDGRFEPATRVLSDYLDQDKTNLRVLYAKASILYKLNEQTRAIHTIRELLAVDPNHVQGLNFLGYHMLTEDKDSRGAYGVLKKAFELSPEDPYILDSWGWYWVMAGDLKKGVSFLEKAYLFKPDDVTILEHLVGTLMNLGELEKAKYFLDMGNSFGKLFSEDEKKKLRILANRLQDLSREYRSKKRSLASEE